MGATHQPSGTVVDRASEAFGRYQAGERAALDELVEVVTPLLWRTARAAGLETASAEDVVQTVWLSPIRLTSSTTRRSSRAARKLGSAITNTSSRDSVVRGREVREEAARVVARCHHQQRRGRSRRPVIPSRS